MEKIKRHLNRDALLELIRYVLVGALTTLVNYGVYWLFRLPFGENPSKLIVSVGICVAWMIAVAVAYVANKAFVFRSRAAGRAALLREIGAFLAARLLSLGFDVVFVLAMMNWARMNDMLAKAISNVVVIAVNYFASKWWIFKK